MNTKKLVFTAASCAVAIVLMLVVRIPVGSFLTYDPKDIVIVILGFIFGPLYALIASFVTALVEFVTISDTGIIGFVMNFLASASFSVTAAAVYRKKHTRHGAWIALISGILLFTVFMLLWNYIVTPFYMGVPREAVAKMLIPLFLPFNLGKGCVNSLITVLIYKPIVSALRKGNII